MARENMLTTVEEIKITLCNELLWPIRKLGNYKGYNYFNKVPKGKINQLRSSITACICNAIAAGTGVTNQVTCIFELFEHERTL